MSEYLTIKESVEWRDHYDGRLEATVLAMAEHEKSIRNSGRWLVGLVATILAAYATIAMTTSLHAEDQQTLIDNSQNTQMRSIQASLAEIAASQARSSAIQEAEIKASAERKEIVDKTIERNREEVLEHRNRSNAHR